MLNSYKNIYIQETEVKPNKYTISVLIFTLFTLIFCWVFNEVGFFRVEDRVMRIGSIFAIIAVITPILIYVFDKSCISNPKMKYLMIVSSAIFSFVITTLMTFHTAIMFLFPLFVAMVYRSKNVGIIAAIASIFSTIVSPVLGYALGIWDINYFRELILIGTNGGITTITGGSNQISFAYIGEILLYFVLPRLLLVCSCIILMFYVIKIGVKHVENQIKLDKISHRDFLTGLYNQNYFQELYNQKGLTGNVGIIFFDVNGLKYINDTMGHEYGDLLLRNCAKSILSVCDDVSTYAFRYGGDEFILVIEGATDDIVIQKHTDCVRALDVINKEAMNSDNPISYSMAAGYSVGDYSKLTLLIKEADAMMYRNKKAMKGIIE